MTEHLGKFVWSDGVILNYSRDKGGLIAYFRDYSKEEWKLHFTGDELEVYENDVLGYSGFAASLEATGGRTRLTLRDDEGIVFSVVFNQCVIEPSRSVDS